MKFLQFSTRMSNECARKLENEASREARATASDTEPAPFSICFHSPFSYWCDFCCVRIDVSPLPLHTSTGPSPVCYTKQLFILSKKMLTEFLMCLQDYICQILIGEESQWWCEAGDGSRVCALWNGRVLGTLAILGGRSQELSKALAHLHPLTARPYFSQWQ